MLATFEGGDTAVLMREACVVFSILLSYLLVAVAGSVLYRGESEWEDYGIWYTLAFVDWGCVRAH